MAHGGEKFGFHASGFQRMIAGQNQFPVVLFQLRPCLFQLFFRLSPYFNFTPGLLFQPC